MKLKNEMKFQKYTFQEPWGMMSPGQVHFQNNYSQSRFWKKTFLRQLCISSPK